MGVTTDLLLREFPGFDDRLREIARAIPELVVHLFGEAAESGRVEAVSRALPGTRRSPDAVSRMGGQLWHAEFQSWPDARMPRRMGGCLPLLATRHGVPVRSLVLYLCRRLPEAERRGEYRLPETPENPATRIGYRVVVLPELAFDDWVSEATPSLAVLGPRMRGGRTPAALHRAVGLLKQHYGDHPLYRQLVTLQFLLAELNSCVEEWRRCAHTNSKSLSGSTPTMTCC